MIIQCHECGSQVSTEARACVNCGAPPKISAEFGTHETSHQGDHFVSFDKAQYEVDCPTCGSAFVVKGKPLASNSFIKCPNPHTAGQGQQIAAGSFKRARLIEGQIIYRRWNDFFSYSGRLSVADYWLSMLLVLPALVIILLIPMVGTSIIFCGLLAPLFVKRYHDHGMRGEWVIVQCVAAVTSTITVLLIPNVLASGHTYPVFGFIHGIAMLAAIVTGVIISCVPGQSKINRYGPPKSDVKRVWW
jgi:uncharacterized membrane protein YhaH (DUF805 family)/DNA-directed RNA polymerase subunit RPC12/RpoP